MKIDTVAKICHTANKIYCESLGDNSQPEWELAREDIKESARDGVKGILNCEIPSPRESHENWVKFKLGQGWTLGPVKDLEKKEHPLLVRYEEVPIEHRQKDLLFFEIVNSFYGFEFEDFK